MPWVGNNKNDFIFEYEDKGVKKYIRVNGISPIFREQVKKFEDRLEFPYGIIPGTKNDNIVVVYPKSKSYNSDRGLYKEITFSEISPNSRLICGESAEEKWGNGEKSRYARSA